MKARLGVSLLCYLGVAAVLSAAPTITELSPVRQVLSPGQSLNLSVTATVDGEVHYQWIHNGVPVGTDSNSYSVSSATPADAGWYLVGITDNQGTTQSATIFVTVAIPGLVWGEIQPGLLPVSAPRAIADGVAQVFAGFNQSLFIKEDGTLWAMGHNTYGQLGDGTNINRSTPAQVATGVASVVFSTAHTMFLKTDGTLWGMGMNVSGQLGDGSTTNRNTPVQVATGVAKVVAGSGHTIFLRTDGTLWGMGNNNGGELGDGTNISRSTPVPVIGGTGVVAIAAGNNYTMFIKADGTLWGMGLNGNGELGDGTTARRYTPVPVIEGTGVARVVIGNTCTLFLRTDGTLWGTGRNNNGQLGDDTTTNRSTPGLIDSGVAEVSAHQYGSHTMYLKTDGTLWGMGQNNTGQLGDGSSVNRSMPVQAASNVASVTAGTGCTMFFKSDGTLWGMGGGFPLGLGTENQMTPVQLHNDIVSVSLGVGYSMFLREDGILLASGANNAGQLGDRQDPPFPPPLITDVVHAGANYVSNVYVKDDGSLWEQRFGAAATQVAGVTGVIQAIAGISDGPRLYLKSDSTLWLLAADGTSTQVASDVISAGAGHRYYVYLRRDGTLWKYGQFATGAAPDGQVANHVVSVSAANYHMLYVKDDHTLWGMGTAWLGLAPYGNPIEHLELAPYPLEAGVVAAFASTHSGNRYIKTDGTLWTRDNGWNDTLSGPAVQVDTNVLSAAGGSVNGVTGSLYLKADGILRFRSGVKGTLGNVVEMAGGVSQVVGHSDGWYWFIQAAGHGTAPAITTQPQSATISAGTARTLEVIATGTGPMTYQWFKDGVAIPWAQAAEYTIPYALLTDAGDYTVTITNSAGSITSDPAELTVNQATQPAPVITSGSSVTFSESYTATTNLGFGDREWSLGTGSTASGAAINATTGAIGFTSVGTVVIKVRFAGDSNYEASAESADFTVTVNKATPVIIWADPSAITYGTALGATHLNATANVAGTFTYSPAGGTVLSAGTHTLEATFTPTDTTNYSTVTAQRSLTVNKAQAVISLGGQSHLPGSLSASWDGTAKAVTAWTQGVVTTYSGAPGSPGSVDGPGDTALFHSPEDAVVDAAGNVFVVDTRNNSIRKITPAGVVTTFAGLASRSAVVDGTGGAAGFFEPEKIAIDGAGNLYVADRSGQVIRKITPTGVVTTLAGFQYEVGSIDATGSAARFAYPAGVAVDGAGTVYVSDSSNHTIRKISPEGAVTTLAGSNGSSGSADGSGNAARFYYPRGLAVDAAGIVYVADYFNRTIRMISPAGVVSTVAGEAGMSGSTDGAGSAARFTSPHDVSVDGDGNLYVADNRTIRKIVPSTGYTVTTLAGNPNAPAGAVDGTGSAARFNSTEGLFADQEGTIYVADTGNNQIRKVSSGGVVTTLAGVLPSAGAVDGPVSGARFSGPRGLAVDGAGNLYLSDSSNNTIRKISATGVVTTLAGTAPIGGSIDGTGSTVRFLTPEGIAVNSAGDIYVADQNNHTIRKITPAGVVTTLAGSALASGSADGTGSAARFFAPTGLVLDGAGNLYVADRSNYTIRKVTPAGVVTTIAGSAGLSGFTDGTGSNARFYTPMGIARDAAGCLYVVDGNTSLLRKITPDPGETVWTVTTLDLGYEFVGARGLGVDPTNGILYVTAAGRHMIGRVTPDGTITAIAGTYGVGGEKDGNGDAAQFYDPSSVVVDGAGDLFVTDYYGNTVRKISRLRGTFTLTYNGSTTAPSAPGSYTVVATLDDPNNEGSATDTLTIYPAQQPAPVVTSASSTVLGQVYTATTTTGFGATQWSVRPESTASGAAIDPSTGVVSFTGVGTVVLWAWFAGDGNHSGSQFTVFTLTVNGPPVISSLSPTRHVLTPGQELSLGVTATTSGTTSYQWIHNGQPVSGATTANYFIPSITYQDSGWYAVDVTNPYGTTRSAPMFVTVAPTVTQIVKFGYGDVNSIYHPPTNLQDAVRVAAAALTGFALRANGTITAWGDTLGVGTVPVGLSEVVAVSAGGFHALALRSDSTVVAWGESAYGKTAVPTGLSGVVAVAAGGDHSLALKSDGTVVAWGYNLSGQSTVPTGLSGIVAIAAGYNHSLALKSDGTVVGWGYNLFGQITVPGGLTDVVAIAAGGDFSLALKSDGTVVAWGANDSGQLNQPVGLANVTALASRGRTSLALKSNGTVVAWGYGGAGQTDVPATLSEVMGIAVSGNLAFALRDATAGTTPIISTHPASQTKAVGLTATFTVAASGGTASLTYQWRKGGTPIFGATSTSLVLSNLAPGDAGSYDVIVTNFLGSATSNAATLTVRPVPVVTSESPAGNGIVLAPGQTLNLSVTATTTGTPTYQWIHNGRAIPGATESSYSISATTYQDSGWYAVDVTDSFDTVRSGPKFVTVAPATTQVRVWGGSFYGVDLTPPSNLTDAVSISAGDDFTLAVRRNGSVAGWGSNLRGRLDIPAGLSGVVAVSAGWDHALALRADGTVVAWGYAISGKTDVPANLTNVVAIAAGYSHSLALKSDGTVVAWGGNYYGESDVPVNLDHVIAIAVGTGHSLALRADGSLVAWGGNANGESTVPSEVGLVAAVEGGGGHTLVLKTDGTVRAFGWNHLGQSDVPPGLANVIAVAAGQAHNLALRQDGTVTGWGGTNGFGETSAPADLAQVFSVSAGTVFSVALRDASGNQPPTASFTLTNERQVGQYITASVTVGDPNGNYSYATFWVLSPTRGWMAIKADSSLVVGGGLSPTNTVAPTAGTHTRSFTFTPTDGPGQYTFALTAVDSEGLVTSAPQQSVTVTSASNQPPTASFTLSNERQVGQSITASVTVGDPNFNYSYATLWVLSPLRGWMAIKADNSLVVGGGLSPINTVATTAGTHTRSFTFTPTDGPGQYTFALTAVDSEGLVTSAPQQNITVTSASNQPPTASFTLSSERQVGQSITASVTVGDPDGNYSYATLWVLSPLRGWMAIKTDNSLVVGGGLSPINTVATTAGTHTRSFTFTPTDGPGQYTFALTAVDSEGLVTSAPQQNITVTSASNQPPTASFTLSSERQVGQMLTATVTVGDPDGNYSYATLWVLSPTRGWMAIKTDNSLAVGGGLAPTNTVATTAGAHTRSFAFTPTDGPGQYTFALTAVDSAGLATSAPQQSITVTSASNQPPTASFTLSSERQVGQSITAYILLGDSDGNYSYATFWVLSPTRGWMAIKEDNSLVVGGGLGPSNSIATSTGSHSRSFAFTPTDGPGQYSFALAAVDSEGLVTSAPQQTITVTTAANQPPTASFTLTSERQVGQSITASVTVSDPNGNYSYATLWVLSPTRGWMAIKEDNSLVVGGSLGPTNTVASSVGTHARSFIFTPTDGPGPYTFALTAVDSDGVTTSAPQQTITVTSASNQPPTASFTLTSERQVGQYLTAVVTVGDPDGNYSYATLWVLSPTRGWMAIKADSSLVVGGGLGPINTVATSPGTHARIFTFTPTDGPGQYTFALTAVDSDGVTTSAPQQSITITNSTPIPGEPTVLYADDFSGPLSNWVMQVDDAGGLSSWTVSGGELAGYYPLGLGADTNTHSFLLLTDLYQPTGDWDASVDFTWRNDIGNSSVGRATADFGLWSPAGRLSITAGWEGAGSPGPATHPTIYVRVRYWNGSAWSDEVLSTPVASLNWKPAEWNTATLEKRGHGYRLLVNGTEVLQYTDTRLSGVGKLGLHTFGTTTIDDFLLEKP